MSPETPKVQSVRFTDTDRQTIVEAAQVYGMSPSRFIQRAAVARAHATLEQAKAGAIPPVCDWPLPFGNMA